jgi:hypothetical protein
VPDMLASAASNLTGIERLVPTQTAGNHPGTTGLVFNRRQQPPLRADI